jgi:hypothetical protein
MRLVLHPKVQSDVDAIMAAAARPESFAIRQRDIRRVRAF